MSVKGAYCLWGPAVRVSTLRSPASLADRLTDLEGTLRSARGAGAIILRPIETQPWGERSFYCTDPFGNKLCFVAADTLFTAGLLN